MRMWQYNYSNSDYLQHYGILGMRWGIRRFQDKSGRLTAAGKKRYDDDTSNGSPEKKSSKTSKEVGDSFIEKKLGIKLSDKQKTAIKVGVGVAAVALAAYGGYRLYNSDVGKPLRDQVDLFLNRFNEGYDRETFKRSGKLTEHAKKDLSTRDYDSKLRFFKKAREYTPEEDLKAINEGMFQISKGGSNNCGLCTTAYELRRRGYDVRANFAEQGRSVKTLSEFFKNADIQDDSALANRTKTEWMAAIERRLLRQGEGARGNFGGQYSFGGGHSIIYEVTKGRVIFRDGQTGETYRTTRDAIGLFTPGKSNYFRMDNLEINSDNIHNAVSTFGLPRVQTNVMEHDPVQAQNWRRAVLDYRRQYKKNTGYDLSLEAARNVIRRYYGVKV